MTSAIFLLTAVSAERLGELWWAQSNTTLLLSQGAREVSPGHYPAIVILHVLWLASLWAFGWTNPVSSPWLAAFLVLQILRAWTLTTLGRRWTTRIIVLPGAPLIKNGPYRFLSHPNYCVVIGEIAVLPLCLGLFWLSLAFSIANILVLTIRVRAENAALNGIFHVNRA